MNGQFGDYQRNDDLNEYLVKMLDPYAASALNTRRLEENIGFDEDVKQLLLTKTQEDLSSFS
ncbi:MAG: hypothetical protein GXP45_02990 [bacterium]|nr:hypothetical protein [bacterium]